MSAEEVLRINEKNALENNQIISHVSGKNIKSSHKKKVGLFSAGAFITIAIIFFAVFLTGGNYAISAISEMMVNATDVQYADSVYSKALVFQQAMIDGDVPANTVKLLKEKGVLVGYLNGDGFFESNTHEGGVVVKYRDKIIYGTNNQFVDTLMSDAGLYEIFTYATYNRAGNYYDKAAQRVFRKLGTVRNNYTANSDLGQVINSIMGEGSDININNVIKVEKTDDEGNTYYDYELAGSDARSSSTDADKLVSEVLSKSASETDIKSALQTAESLNIADNMTRAQRASLFYALIMENISKTKAGDGNEAKINEVMNLLYETTESKVVDVKTGELLTITGSMIESPSMYAILSGEMVDVGEVGNYANDKVLNTIKNKLGVETDKAIMNKTLASTNDSGKRKGAIGWLSDNGEIVADISDVGMVAPTIDSSLIDNSFNSINGVAGGEFFVDGAVELGKELAKQSGATPGDKDAVVAYSKVNSEILALEAEVDRNSRSPFDITSKNTFLGSIIYKLAISTKGFHSNWGEITTIPKIVASSVSDILPTTYADDETDGYLTSFGENCETLNNIDAVGSAGCSEIATFDVSTVNDIFNDPEFIKFVEENTTLGEDGVRTINPGSKLAQFILYNNERETPVGVIDGGILDSVMNNSSDIRFLSDILSMVKKILGASEYDLKVASGEVFVNSSNNLDWQTYKYAQRYVSLARATEALRQYDGDSTAYINLKYFEGETTPVTAFLNSYYNIASN